VSAAVASCCGNVLLLLLLLLLRGRQTLLLLHWHTSELLVREMEATGALLAALERAIATI
jgi:hypothetical protein